MAGPFLVARNIGDDCPIGLCSWKTLVLRNQKTGAPNHGPCDNLIRIFDQNGAIGGGAHRESYFLGNIQFSNATGGGL